MIGIYFILYQGREKASPKIKTNPIQGWLFRNGPYPTPRAISRRSALIEYKTIHICKKSIG